MQRLIRIQSFVLPLALCAIFTAADAQGRGQGKGADKSKANPGRADQPATPRSDKAKPQTRDDAQASRQRGNADRAARDADRGRVDANRGRRSSAARADNDAGNRGRSATAPNPSAVAMERASSNARFKRSWTAADVRPELRRFISSNRAAEAIAAGALAHAYARNIRDNALVITPSGRQMLVRNRAGDLLVALDDNHARNLGHWRVRPLDNRVGEGAPSFCRSGAGHPQWGRQWCVDKGFGLGSDSDLRWGNALDSRDVVFLTEPTSASLTRDALAAVLGNVVVDRLALHAITLGLVDPLVGTWRTEPAGARVLLVNSGGYPVAEIVDVDRDRRGDRMLFALRPW